MKNKFIFLVEDNPDDVIMTIRALKKGNIMNEVVVAKNGVEALDFLFCTGKYSGRDMGEAPQVILLDLNMPRISGLEVLQRIRADERTKLLPVVVLTTSGEDRDRIESYRLGINSYIQKPVNCDEFIKAIQVLGLYWLVLNKAP